MEMTIKQQGDKRLGPFVSVPYLDEKYGEGQWRFVPRFVVHQAEKDRLIDDARRGARMKPPRM